MPSCPCRRDQLMLISLCYNTMLISPRLSDAGFARQAELVRSLYKSISIFDL